MKVIVFYLKLLTVVFFFLRSGAPAPVNLGIFVKRYFVTEAVHVLYKETRNTN